MRKVLQRFALAVLHASVAWLFAANPAHADEGGVSFWLPGQLASFAAVPGEPGWSVPLVYFHESANSGGQKNFIVGGNLVAGIDAKADLVFFAPTYTFAQPVLGGQAALSVVWAAGSERVRTDAVITGPRGNGST